MVSISDVEVQMRTLAILPLWIQFTDWIEEKAAERRIQASRREYESQCRLFDEAHAKDQASERPVLPQPRPSQDEVTPLYG